MGRSRTVGHAKGAPGGCGKAGAVENRAFVCNGGNDQTEYFREWAKRFKSTRAIYMY